MNRRSGLPLILRALIACVALAAINTASATAEERVQFNIAPQDLLTALNEFAQQSDQELLFSSEVAAAKRTSGVTGEFFPSEALRTLLEGTGLGYRVTSENTILIERTGEDAPDRRAEKTGSVLRTPLVLAQATPPFQAAQQETQNRNGTQAIGDNRDEGRLGAMTVTGTHIRGDAPVGAQIITIERIDIDKSGFATAQELVRALPQNFGGGPSEDSFLGLEASTNVSKATALNLRGVGPGATLVLVDGRRLAAAGTEGSFTDVSSIPLAAVERVEVLPDGASAIYGADAVGGVVNFRLRRDYEGLETRARMGSVTDGGLREYQFSQGISAKWGTDSLGLFSYEFYERDSLPNSARAQTSDTDLRPLGGSNWSTPESNPGTISIGGQTWAIPPGQNGQSLTPSDFTAGTSNLANLHEGRWVLPEQRRHSAFALIQQELSAPVMLSAEALFSKREGSSAQGGLVAPLRVPNTNAFYVNPTGGTQTITVQYNLIDDLGPKMAHFDVETYNAGVGIQIEPGHDWAFNLDAGYARELQDQRNDNVDSAALSAALADSNPATAFNPFGDGSFTNPATLAQIRSQTSFGIEADLWTFSAVADGPIFSLPTGETRLAIGAEHRRPSFRSRFDAVVPDDSTNAQYERTIDAAYAEVRIPVWGPQQARTGMRQLDLSLAGRYESYSDFGDTANPKIGLSWGLTNALSLHGTWSKSFKAPNLGDLDESGNISLLSTRPDPQSPTGFSQILQWIGKNADLQEETATIWTAGVTVDLTAPQGLELALTYFDIEFSDRIEDPPVGVFLADPVLAPLVTRNPTPEQRQAVCSRSQFLGNPDDCLNAPIAAIVDRRVRNTAVNNTSGFDLIGSYGISTAAGTIDLGVNATYVVEFDRALLPTSPVEELLDTATNPIDLKLRGNVSWSRGRWGATAFVNYADSYTDRLSEPDREIGSWTTVDLQLGYRIEPEEGGWLADTDISLNVQNAFDRDPPFLDNPAAIGYDQQNADVLGRFVSLQLRKGW